MSFPQTPNRPLPGTYIQTPGPNLNPPPPIFQPNLPKSFQPNGSQNQGQAVAQPPQPGGQGTSKQSAEYVKPIQRAAKTINDTLAREAQYPELDSYVGRK